MSRSKEELGEYVDRLLERSTKAFATVGRYLSAQDEVSGAAEIDWFIRRYMRRARRLRRLYQAAFDRWYALEYPTPLECETCGDGDVLDGSTYCAVCAEELDE